MRSCETKTNYYFVIVSDHTGEQATYTMSTKWEPKRVRDRFHATAWFEGWTVKDTHFRMYESREAYKFGEQKAKRPLRRATVIKEFDYFHEEFIIRHSNPNI